MARKKGKQNTPNTKLRFSEFLEGVSITKLANEMGLTYTQLYQYKKSGANPTLLTMEKLAEALSQIRQERITIIDLIAIKDNEKKGTKKVKRQGKQAGT